MVHNKDHEWKKGYCKNVWVLIRSKNMKFCQIKATYVYDSFCAQNYITKTMNERNLRV